MGIASNATRKKVLLIKIGAALQSRLTPGWNAGARRIWCD
jgi:hypothetical protein